MRRIFTLFFFAGLTLLAACEPADNGNGNANGTTDPPADSTKEQPPVLVEFASPEGVTSDGEYIYVSNVGKELAPQAVDGDGYILKLTPDLKMVVDADKWSALKLNAPKGMAIVNKRLYVADIDRLVVIDLKKVEQEGEFDFRRFGVTFLNDVAIRDDSTLYVSATNSNQIFQVNLLHDNFERLETEDLHGPNGLYYQSEERKLYCVEWGTGEPNGRIIAIDPPTGKIRVLNDHTGNLDGLSFLRSGDMVLSDWTSNSLLTLNMVDGEISRLPTDSMLGPADFYYDMAGDQLYIPHMMESKVSIVPGGGVQ
jgi:DNA-binding beta-propeller fold protein YncE